MGIRFFHLGVWVPHVWAYWVNTNTGLPSDIPWQLFYLAAAMSVAVTAFAYWQLQKNSNLEESPRIQKLPGTIDWINAVLLCIATVCCVSPRLFSVATFIPLLGTLIGGWCQGWFLLRWAVFVSHTDIKQTSVILLVSIIPAAIARIMLMSLPLPISLTIAALLPFVSSQFLHLAIRKTPVPSSTPLIRYRGKQLYQMWRIWLLIFGITLIYSITVETGVGTFPVMTLQLLYLQNTISILLCSLILLWIFRTSFNFGFIVVWQGFLIVFAVLLACVALAPESNAVHILINCSSDIISALFFMTICDMARHSNLNPYVSIGFGLAFYLLPSFFGLGFANRIFNDLPFSSVGILLLLSLFVISVFALNPNDRAMRYVFEDLRGQALRPSDFAEIDERCRQLGTDFELSKREIEVMQMICRGRSRSYIAETLFITENTAKTHVSHIYTKLGIHSKKELQQLLEL